MVKNLKQICDEKGFATYGELFRFIKNKKLKVIKSSRASGHNWKPVVLVKGVTNTMESTSSLLSTNSPINHGILGDTTQGSTSIYLEELTLHEVTKQDLINELAEITNKFKTQEAEIKSKIQTMKEVGIDVYDEKLITLVSAMGNLEFKRGSDMDKVKLAKTLMSAF